MCLQETCYRPRARAFIVVERVLHPRERALLVTEEKQSTGSSSLIRRWRGGHAVRASLLRLEEKPELCRLGLRLCSMPSVCEDFRSGLRPRSDGEDLSEVERGRGSWRCQLWSVVGLPGGPGAQLGVGGGCQAGRHKGARRAFWAGARRGSCKASLMPLYSLYSWMCVVGELGRLGFHK